MTTARFSPGLVFPKSMDAYKFQLFSHKYLTKYSVYGILNLAVILMQEKLNMPLWWNRQTQGTLMFARADKKVRL